MANALSHGLGILLVLAFSPLLFIKAHLSEIKNLPLAIGVYVLGLLMVFTFSTLYHATVNLSIKKILRVFDHISIFILIGGTYLPLVLLHADPTRAKYLLTIQWLIILAGIIKKVFFTGRFEALSTSVYVVLGIMTLGTGKTFWQSLPTSSLYLIVAGGLMYLIGVVFYQNRKLAYGHFIWHIFVLTAAILHFLAIYLAF